MADADVFWAAVKTNLDGGRVRLVFVADVIPPELRRIVEFLNGQMAPAEVLAVEIRQFVGQGMKTLVPRVIGQTAQADTRKGKEPARVWTRDLFLQRVKEQLSRGRGAAVEDVVRACEAITDDMGYGRGRAGSISPKFARASAKSFFTIREDGRLWINLAWHDQPEAGPDAPRYRDDFMQRLRSKGFRIADTPYPGLAAEEWIDRAPELIRVVRELFAAGA